MYGVQAPKHNSTSGQIYFNGELNTLKYPEMPLTLYLFMHLKKVIFAEV